MALDKYRDWDTFVRVIREDINRFTPSATSGKAKPRPTWDEFVADFRLRISIDGDRLVSQSIADKDAEIANLKAQIEKLESDNAELRDQKAELPIAEEKQQVDLSAIYLSQIEAAQLFLNGNHHADLSHTKDLLRMMLPQQFHTTIEQLKDRQEPKVIHNHFAPTQVLPKAVKAEQHIRQ